MTKHKNISKYLLMPAIVMLLLIICNKSIYADSRFFKGNSTYITLNKSCKEESGKIEMELVINGDKNGFQSGWFHGKGTETAEFNQTSPMHFEVNYPFGKYIKMPPSSMEFVPIDGGFRAIIRDHIPEDMEILKSTCFFEEAEINLKLVNQSADIINTLGKDLFLSELFMIEAKDLLNNQNKYVAAEDKAQKALVILERIYGKLSKETLRISVIMVVSMARLERFDEALEVIAPYRKKFPDNKRLKVVEETIQKWKKEQDDLFKYNNDNISNVDLEPLA